MTPEGYKEPNAEGIPPIPEDPFVTLGVSKGARKTDIKAAYERLSSLCNPDTDADWLAALAEARDILVKPRGDHAGAQHYASFDSSWGNSSKSKSPIEMYFADQREGETAVAEDSTEEEGQETAEETSSEETVNREEPEVTPTPESAEWNLTLEKKEELRNYLKSLIDNLNQELTKDPNDTALQNDIANISFIIESLDSITDYASFNEVFMPLIGTFTTSEIGIICNGLNLNYKRDIGFTARESQGRVNEDHVDGEQTEDAVEEETPTVDGPTPEEREKQLDEALAQARDVYATKLIEWKNATREKKGVFKKLLSDLGIEKQMPHAERSQELQDAENEYILAKKNKSEQFFGKNKIETKKSKFFKDENGDFEEYEVTTNPDLMEQAEREYETLQQKILDSVPPLEKGIVTKAFERWAKLSPLRRVALSTALMTGGAMLFGTLGVAGAITYAGARATRSLTGAAVGQVAGKGVDKFQKRTIRKNKEEALKDYGDSIDMDSFERKERELMEYFDKQESKIKRQRLTKMAAVVAAGAGANYGASMLQSQYMPSGAVHDATMEKSAKNFLDKHHPVPPDQKVLDAELNEQIAKTGLDTKVDLSSRGFIQTFDDLKAKLVEQYGGADKIPPQIKTELFDKPSTQLAQEYGFYDPEKHLSGMGYKGEHFEVDHDGKFIYEHTDGSKDIMYDSKTGYGTQFHGKMFGGEDAPAEPEAEVEATPETPDPKISVEKVPTPEAGPDWQGLEQTPDMPPVVPEGIPDTPSATEATSNLDTATSTHVPFHNGFVDVVQKGNLRQVVYDNAEIAHEHVVINTKVLMLDDKFQAGSKFKEIREAFSAAANQQENLTSQFGKIPTIIPFEGGSVHIVHGLGGDSNSLTILLNGKEIAKGILTHEGSKIKLLDTPGIKSGWFSTDTPYEKAFKEARKFTKGFTKF